jgi:hypothetical protein
MNVTTSKKQVGRESKPAAPAGTETVTLTLPADLVDEIRAVAGIGTPHEISVEEQAKRLIEHALGRRPAR